MLVGPPQTPAEPVSVRVDTPQLVTRDTPLKFVQPQLLKAPRPLNVVQAPQLFRAVRPLKVVQPPQLFRTLRPFKTVQPQLFRTEVPKSVLQPPQKLLRTVQPQPLTTVVQEQLLPTVIVEVAPPGMLAVMVSVPNDVRVEPRLIEALPAESVNAVPITLPFTVKVTGVPIACPVVETVTTRELPQVIAVPFAGDVIVMPLAGLQVTVVPVPLIEPWALLMLMTWVVVQVAVRLRLTLRPWLIASPSRVEGLLIVTLAVPFPETEQATLVLPTAQLDTVMPRLETLPAALMTRFDPSSLPLIVMPMELPEVKVPPLAACTGLESLAPKPM